MIKHTAKSIDGGETASRECPKCHSKRTTKDGVRETKVGSVQRRICKDCFYRFSESSILSIHLMNSDNRQVCVLRQEAKNLATATENKTVAGEENKATNPQLSAQDARITQYEWKSKKRGLLQSTIDLRKYHLGKLLEDGADLNDPETVETVLATRNYETPTKWLRVQAYRSYCKMFSIQWEPIKVNYQPKMPYIPTQEECQIFIAGLSRTLSIFCRVLFETGARRGEACKIERTDINEESSTAAINHPEKGSNARMIRVSRECIDLLKTLSRKHGTYIFNPNPKAYDASFCRQRRRIAEKTGKPQFLKIHFHTFRHVRATLDIHNNVPIQEIQQNLGHRYLANTEKYTHWNKQLYLERNDRYCFSSVSTDEEAGKLIETG